MALQIVRNDLARVVADAIVIPANPSAKIGGGTETSIYTAAGKEKLLAARKKIGDLQPGEVAATEAFDLQAKILIHAVSSAWSNNDTDLKILRACYEKSLELAREKNCRSIAFPLLGTGNNRIPKEKALLAAVATIQKFLATNEMEVFLVIFGQRTFELATNFFGTVQSFIDERAEKKILQQEYSPRITPQNFFVEYNDEKILRDVLNHWGKDFKSRINELVAASELSNKEIYMHADVRKKVYYDAINFVKCIPTKKILLALIFSLKLSMPDAIDLLARAEYMLKISDPTDALVVDFLRRKIYDVDEINSVLEDRGLEKLGSK